MGGPKYPYGALAPNLSLPVSPASFSINSDNLGTHNRIARAFVNRGTGLYATTLATTAFVKNARCIHVCFLLYLYSFAGRKRDEYAGRLSAAASASARNQTQKKTPDQSPREIQPITVLD